MIETVWLDKKTIAGLSARTGNKAPDMGKIIGGLWKRLFEEGVISDIQNRSNDRIIGLYSDYESDVSGEYDITVGCEIDKEENLPEGLVVKTIPAGSYARFVAQGDDVQAVSKLWQEIWSLPLDRTYTGDFEEYYTGHDGMPKEAHIYVAVK